jgi:Fe-S-cluster containining protein
MDNKDVVFSKKNRAKAIELIPINLIKKEEVLLTKTRNSKRKPIGKLLELYDFMADISKPFQHLTPCKSKCSNCCNIQVDVSDLEMLIIKKNAKKQIKKAVRGRVVGEPCPFLIDNLCSIYEFRPFVCRRHQVFTPTNELCKKESDIGQELLNFTEVDRSFSYIISESGLNSQKDIREYFTNMPTLTVLE